MTFGVTFSQSTNGRVFDKSVGNIVCGVESVVHQDARYHATTFKTSEKSTALDFISLVACNLLHEVRTSLMWRMTFGVTLGQSANGRYSINAWATSCAVWNLSCIKMHATMSNYIKRQKVRWISTTFKTSEKSTALYFISLITCNLLHEIRNH